MYGVIKKVIDAKRFELSDILKKIDTVWVQGSITDEQKSRLVQLAREGANVQDSIDVMAKLEELDRRVAALENGKSPIEDEGAYAVEEFVVGKYYYAGNKVSFGGKNYICIAPEGVVCVWSPSDYPAYWQIEE